MNDPYAVLGVSKNATDDEIKNAYRDLPASITPITIPIIRFLTLQVKR